MESWQVFHAAQKGLPKGTLQKIYRKSCRLVYYWAADPRYTDEVKRNPLDRIRMMLEQLDLAGCGNFARWAIDYLAEPLGGCFAYKNPARSDKDSIDGEIADVAVAMGKLADEIRYAAEDGKITRDELARVDDYGLELHRQVDELLEVAKRAK